MSGERKVARGSDAGESKYVSRRLEGHNDSVNSVACSPDNKYIASASSDCTIKVWNANSGRLVFTIGTQRDPFDLEQTLGNDIQHTESVQSVSFSPDSKYIVSGSWDGTVRIWDATDGTPVRKYSVQGSGTAYRTPVGAIPGYGTQARIGVLSVAWAPDGRHIAIGATDNAVRVWNWDEDDVSDPFKGHSNQVSSVSFHCDSMLIVSGSLDNTLRVWSLDGKCVLAIGTPYQQSRTSDPPGPHDGHLSSVECVQFSPNGERIVSGSYDRTARIWNFTQNDDGSYNAAPFQTITCSRDVSAVSFSHNSDRIVTASSDEIIQEWNVSTGELYETHARPPSQGSDHDQISSVAVSSNGLRIVCGSWDCMCTVWEDQVILSLLSEWHEIKRTLRTLRMAGFSILRLEDRSNRVLNRVYVWGWLLPRLIKIKKRADSIGIFIDEQEYADMNNILDAMKSSDKVYKSGGDGDGGGGEDAEFSGASGGNQVILRF